MAQQSLQPCCISGHLHDGQPKGQVSKIAGMDCYIAAPETGKKDKTILIIADVFGYQLPVCWEVEMSLNDRMCKSLQMSGRTRDSMSMFQTSSMVSPSPPFPTQSESDRRSRSPGNSAEDAPHETSTTGR